MSKLFRYIVRNNVMFLLPGLGMGMGIYVITDLFEKLDNFIDAKLPISLVLSYFLYKTPLIISQILPVVFLLATVVQICLMIRSREMVALHAGGVSPWVVTRALCFCGIFWAIVQLGFSQWLGVAGEQEAYTIWQEKVHKRNMEHVSFNDVWFTEGSWVVSLDTLKADGTGNGLTAYYILTNPDGRQEIDRIVKAGSFAVQPGHWLLGSVIRYYPSRYEHQVLEQHELDLSHDMTDLRLMQSNAKPQQLSMWDLGGTIDKLSSAGANVESLRTAWHAKGAYAASIAFMSLVAMAIVRLRENIYIASGLALVSTFAYYAVYTMTLSLGQKGFLPPFLAAWMANLVAGILALTTLSIDSIRYAYERSSRKRTVKGSGLQ